MGHMGPPLAANGPTLVASTLYYMQPQETVKSAEPQPSTCGTGKNCEIAKIKYKGEEESVKSKENRIDAMFVLFWGVFE